MSMTREQIMAQPKKRVKEIGPVPGWEGGTVCIRTLSGAERDAWETGLNVGFGKSARPNLANIRARFAVLVLCDAAGERLFEDKDAPALGEHFAGALDFVWDEGREFNGLNAGDVERIESFSEPPTGPN